MNILIKLYLTFAGWRWEWNSEAISPLAGSSEKGIYIMASISTAKNGSRRIQFTDPSGIRKTLYLGKMPKRATESIRLRVEELLAAKIIASPLSTDCAEWLAKTDDLLYQKLVNVGLVLSRVADKTHFLGDWLESYQDCRNDLKPATKVVQGHVIRDLKTHFGKERDIKSIDHADADSFLQWLIGRKLAPTTVNKRIQVARSYFSQMKRRKLIEENPFDGVRAPVSGARKKQRFITRQDITSVLDACPNHDWRMIVALARYGGLRCPTEVLSVRWQDINWEKGRIIVTSPKTEHHPDGGTRVIPLFPELRPELEKAFELAPEGAVYVVDEKFRKAANGENGWLNANLRTTFQKIIKRAGLIPWPRPFQNLRASRETELVERFPIQTVTSWLGNSPRIAMKHYLQTTETHFENALKADPETTHSATQPASEIRRNRSQVEMEKCKNPEKTGVSRGSNALKVAGTGFEPATSRL